jgi:ubiquitin-conjugating enzyme E2 W
MDLLYTGSGGAYSPALTVAKLCLALRSMLASATAKEAPADDRAYSERARVSGRGPKATQWLFHDERA